ncbi:MAG: ATP-grasp domain-containing protein [Sphingobacteriales bacterium]|nr:ATP-grasp domain-containing protein [Sphingobacteriales bacterium]
MKTADNLLTIAVTGLNAIDSPGPGIAVIRGLREGLDRPVRIIGLSYETLEPGIYMRELVDKTYQVPYPAAGSAALLNRLHYIHEKENLQLVIPNFDAELNNFIRISPELKAMRISSFLPTAEQLGARDKINLYRFGKEHRFLVPRDRIIYSPAELKECAETLGYPLVVKGKFYDAVLAYTMEQAEKAFYKIMAKWGLPVIVQEFIQGTEVNIAVLGDGKGNTVSAIPMRKLYITDKGKAWAGITLEDASLIRLAHDFISATQWRGGCELEIMRTKNEELYIMEINPRFPAWIYLSAAAGQNQPAALARMALGEEQPVFEHYEAGKIFIRYSWDMITDINAFHQVSGKGEW